MEEEGIGLVLERATELRLKIGNCVHRATNSAAPPPGERREDGEVHEAEEGEEAETLFSICDALEALESQLSSLQVTSLEAPLLRFLVFPPQNPAFYFPLGKKVHLTFFSGFCSFPLDFANAGAVVSCAFWNASVGSFCSFSYLLLLFVL